MSDWSLTPATYAGGTIKINTTSVESDAHTSFSISEKPVFREVLVGANFPYGQSEFVMKQASGSFEYVLPSGTGALPVPATCKGALEATFVGCHFTGNVKFTGFKADFKNSVTDAPTASIDFESEGDYTLTK